MGTATSFSRISLRSWVLIVVVLEAAWFALLYPVVPRSASAAVLELTLPLSIAAYAYIVVRALIWLGGRRLSPFVRRLLGISLALSVGVFAMVVVYFAQHLFIAGFGRGLAPS